MGKVNYKIIFDKNANKNSCEDYIDIIDTTEEESNDALIFSSWRLAKRVAIEIISKKISENRDCINKLISNKEDVEKTRLNMFGEVETTKVWKVLNENTRNRKLLK